MISLATKFSNQEPSRNFEKASKLFKRNSEIKEMFKELEADTLKDVELIIYRSELAEEFKKKLINFLPEAVGLDH